MIKPLVVTIFGPTGVGKTALSLSLARRFSGEIISVDSRQLYRGMDIGTAKPDVSELSEIKHYLIDKISPDKQYTAGDFKRDAEEIIRNISIQNKLPLCVGGTGLYFNALINGIIEIPKIEHSIKDRINRKFLVRSRLRMYEILCRIDPDYARKIHPNDKQRIVRAIEVCLGTGKRFSEYHQNENRSNEFSFLKFGIKIPRERLYYLINHRVDIMISKGLVEEVRGLLKMGYSEKSPGLDAIGYKEVVSYLKNRIDFDTMVYSIKRNSRRYAKRQLTWFRRIKGVHWYSPSQYEEIEKVIKENLGR